VEWGVRMLIAVTPREGAPGVLTLACYNGTLVAQVVQGWRLGMLHASPHA
jgi:hypothetical protein